MRILAFALPVVLTNLLAPALAHATNGYFSHGYGIKSLGMAGTSIALPQDALAAASNPASIAFVGNRVDAGLLWFRPNRSAKITGNGAGLNGSFSGDGKKNFFMPEFGIVRQLDEQWSASLAIYGNGGMNTRYKANPWGSFGASGTAGVNLEQLFFSPALAWQPAPGHSLGLALNLAYQRFSAQGIQPFAGNSASPQNFSNRGHDSAKGWGVRLGYTGEILPGLTLGLTYASKTRMGTFNKYKGLFADQGRFDIPANYGIGLAWRASPQLTLAADVQHIEYSRINAVGNPLEVYAPFGSNNGPGFGWRDLTVVKLGVSHAVTPVLTLRAGYSRANQPVASSQVMLNILAPGVIREHFSVGASWASSEHGEISLAFTRALSRSVRGELPAQYGGGRARLAMHQDSLGIAYGWTF